MRGIRALLIRMARAFRKETGDRELAEEIESHLQMHVDDNLRSGMSPSQARREAIMKLGGIEQTKENYRERRGLPFLETLFQDLRYGLRMLGKNLGFTATAVLTLALGIGVNTAIFSIVNAVILRPLPYKDSSRLVTFNLKTAMFPTFTLRPSWPAFLAIRSEAASLEQAVACWETDRTLTGTSQPAVLDVAGVSNGFFEELGARPALGRLLTDGDQIASQSRVAVLSNAFWRSRFAGDSLGYRTRADFGPSGLHRGWRGGGRIRLSGARRNLGADRTEFRHRAKTPRFSLSTSWENCARARGSSRCRPISASSRRGSAKNLPKKNPI